MRSSCRAAVRLRCTVCALLRPRWIDNTPRHEHNEKARCHRFYARRPGIGQPCHGTDRVGGDLNGCAYPRVCFYLTNTDWNNRTPTAGYQDITTTYQNLSSRAAGAVVAVNSRQDDRAYLRANVSGTTRYYCLPPQGLISFAPGIVVNGIRIDSAATC